ncbi:MAG: 30S ribosome-binding factor RbfA [Actinobacteria bacterium]|nr:30S ribosome-binding factor RbfA [Actinomycetota bacterium]
MTDHDARVRRLADHIKTIVAQLLEKRVKDPRLGFVTITDVRVTGDMREATIFYTVLGEHADLEATKAALESAKGMIRSEVGRLTGVRFTPFLHFVPDTVPEQAARIEKLLKETAEDDAARAEQAAGAEYAGGPDPYKSSDDEQE